MLKDYLKEQPDRNEILDKIKKANTTYKFNPPDSDEAVKAGKNYKLDKDFGVKDKTTGQKSWDDNYDFGVKGKTTGKHSWEDSKPKQKAKATEPMPTGEIGSVDRTSDVINSAPDMSRTNVLAPVIEDSKEAAKPFRNTDPAKVVDKDRSTWIDPQLQAQRSLGFKKGGFVSHNDHMKQHAVPGFKSHNDHVQSMYGVKGKK